MHWKCNLFKVPPGKAGNSFVKELTRLIRAYAKASALEAVALKAVMAMPHPLLQKSYRTSKAKDHVLQLEHGLRSWAEGDIDQLVHEGRTIQRQLISITSRNPKQEEQSARTFSSLMMEGKVKAALRLISDQERGSVLLLDSLVSATVDTPAKTICDIFLEKHLPSKPLVPSAVCEPSNATSEPHPIQFNQIDGPFIHKVALKMDGAAGPSGIDAAGRKHLCTSFRTHSADLCDALASCQKNLYNLRGPQGF